jgi:hypothetical protein
MLRFPYLPVKLRRPAPTLPGATQRHLPIFSVTLEGPIGSFRIDSRLDSGSDDTVFPLSLAQHLGLDLTGAPLSQSQGVGGTPLSYRCAQVTLRISDGKETCVWQAEVGFVDLPRRLGLLGLTGFLEYFDCQLLGEQRALLLSPNGTFLGQHIVH